MIRGRSLAVTAFSLVLVALGATLLVETAMLGGGFGYLVGALFVLAGVSRIALGRLG